MMFINRLLIQFLLFYAHIVPKKKKEGINVWNSFEKVINSKKGPFEPIRTLLKKCQPHSRKKRKNTSKPGRILYAIVFNLTVSKLLTGLERAFFNEKHQTPKENLLGKITSAKVVHYRIRMGTLWA